ncbi:uncharacterized protein METZ01_LOCUS429262, partial [marine metagenome]
TNTQKKYIRLFYGEEVLDAVAAPPIARNEPVS